VVLAALRILTTESFFLISILILKKRGRGGERG
jgi:hypothetical protein